MRLRTVGVVTVVAAVVAGGVYGVTGSNTITTIAGTGSAGFSGDNGPATAAQLWSPHGIAVDGQGNVYISDFESQRVRKVDTAGTITTFAGGGSGGLGDGGPATAARLNYPWGLAVDGQGNVYIADWANHRVRKVNPAGIITTVAGNGLSGYTGDGVQATATRLYGPRGLAVDGQGNLYIADSYNDRVRRVDTGGIISTVAGTGVAGSSGDGGPATAAQVNYPLGVTVDGQGNVYIADSSNNRVRRVDSGGTITRFAGGGPTLGDGGPATSAYLGYPTGVAVDGQGNIYIADSNNYRVRGVDSAGTITTVAGNGNGCQPSTGPCGDGGPAASANLSIPEALAMDAVGNLYITDTGHHRVRKVLATATSSQSITFAALANKTYGDPDFTVNATASSGLPVTFTASGNCTLSGMTVHITGAGSCTITASQPGGGGYPAAASVSRTFSIAKASQTITFAALANKKVGDPDFTIGASASSRLPVAFAASGRCTVTGARVHLTGAGSCTITATQAGNANYGPAPAVARTFSILGRPAQPVRCRVPRVISMKLVAAKSTIAKRHCRTGKVSYVYSRARRKGVVIGQSRRPGKVLPTNSKINLVVSRGRRR